MRGLSFIIMWWGISLNLTFIHFFIFSDPVLIILLCGVLVVLQIKVYHKLHPFSTSVAPSSPPSESIYGQLQLVLPLAPHKWHCLLSRVFIFIFVLWFSIFLIYKALEGGWLYSIGFFLVLIFNDTSHKYLLIKIGLPIMKVNIKLFIGISLYKY